MVSDMVLAPNKFEVGRSIGNQFFRNKRIFLFYTILSDGFYEKWLCSDALNQHYIKLKSFPPLVAK